jgi:hypothetical protein
MCTSTQMQVVKNSYASDIGVGLLLNGNQPLYYSVVCPSEGTHNGMVQAWVGHFDTSITLP